MNLTIIIIIITAATSIMAFQNAATFYKMKFNAYLINHNRQWYRFFTYALLHADWAHLLVNMFVLWSFGTLVEQLFSIHFGNIATIYFLLLYVGGVMFSTLPSYGKHKNNDFYNAVGASGAVSAVLFSSIIMYPQGSIVFLFFPVPIPAWIFGILYLVYSAYMAKRGSDNIGHDAHFWGAVYGVVFTIALNPSFVPEFFRNILG
ncbi:MAG: rhomboid family intramembrane serine protease [Bacteroidetes bacterium]|nr:MAG: rhomboid family intramembrane serine protease [Bacteroidota bacterium]